MASSAPAKAIEQRLRDNTTLPVYLFEQANPELSQTMEPFLVLEFPGGPGEQMSVGAPLDNWHQERETFLIHYFYPMGRRADEPREVLDALHAVFLGAQFDGVSCWTPDSPVPASQRDRTPRGNWNALSLPVPYYYRRRG